MEPIRQNDYYGIFQTGLLIALEELSVKQAHIAAVCGVSSGYLSRLKSWDMEKESGKAFAKLHKTNTNFKRYAVPLLQFLEQEHQVVFAEGYFTTTQTNTGPRQWGDIATILLPSHTNQNALKRTQPTVILDDIDIPETGEVTIEWNIDLSDPNNLQDMLEKIKRLADKANAQMSIKVVLRKNVKGPDKTLFRYRAGSSTASEPDDNLDLNTREFNTNPYLKLQVEEGHNTFSERLSIKNTLSGTQQEQFCDYSDWEALHREGDWDFTPKLRIIRGSGMNQYLLSRYSYGAHAFSLHAVLQFNGYAQHSGAGTETANAGIILGWQKAEFSDQYYHLLLDGQTMRLEHVGAHSVDHYDDYQHLDAGVPFVIDDGAEYQFLLRVTPERIVVFVDNVLRYQIDTPPGMEGRVGIRPWRAQVSCSYFEIREELMGRLP